MSVQSRFGSVEEENNEVRLDEEDYQEIRGEYEDEYGGEDYLFEPEDNAKNLSRSTRSSRSLVGFRGKVFEQDPNQDLIDALPDDISESLTKYWQQMENTYYPVNENAFDGINQAHNKLLEYSDHFQEQLLKQLDAPDGRENAAQLFKSDFNRVPAHIRITDHVKPILLQRIDEFITKLERITEEKYAQSKRHAFSILSKGNLTDESEKLARLFGILLHVETDRFAETLKFINEHYYKTISIELGLANKIKWKEIMEIGLIKKRFLCEHFRRQCLLREQFPEEGEWLKENSNESSTDSGICGDGEQTGGGQDDFALICEDDEDSTPTDSELTRLSMLNKYGEEEGEMDFDDNDVKMNGEMKLSLEFDNEEFLGEAGWDVPYVSHRTSGAGTAKMSEGRASVDASSRKVTPNKTRGSIAESRKSAAVDEKKEDGTVAKSAAGENKSGGATKKGGSVSKGVGGRKSRKDIKINEEAKVKEEQQGKGSNNNEKNKSSDNKAKKRRSTKKLNKAIVVEEEETAEDDKNEEGKDPHFDFTEEGDEELEMEHENVEVETPTTFYEDEYPGEFWEGEGYDTAAYRHSKKSSKGRHSSVKFDEKETYIRDFFWDSDPSKQETTVASKASLGEEERECKDEGYYDQEEIFDDEDICYDREEYFEKEVEFPKKGQITPEPSTLHFSIFGKDVEPQVTKMSLLNRLLLKWTGEPEQVTTAKQLHFSFEGDTVNGKGVEMNNNNTNNKSDHKGLDKRKSSVVNNDGGDAFSPPTPTSTATKYSDANRKLSAFMGGGDAEVFPEGQNYLLQLNPNTANEEGVHFPKAAAGAALIQQKRPLLECFISLQDEIWSGFETAFKDARDHMEQVMEALKDIVGKAYPNESPKDACDDSLDQLDVYELIARGQAIEEKLRATRQPRKTSKGHRNVHLTFYTEDPGEGEDGEGFSPEYEEDNEEDAFPRRSSFVELVPFQLRKTSSEMGSEQDEHDKMTTNAEDSSEQRAHKEKKSSTDENASPSGSNEEEKQSPEEGVEEDEEEEHVGKKSPRNSSVVESGHLSEAKGETCSESCSASCSKSSSDSHTVSCSDSSSDDCLVQCNVSGVWTGLSLDPVESPQSDASRASTDRKSPLERSLAGTDIRLPSSPLDPCQDERQILKRAKQAMLKIKLQNWENALGTEKARLVRQLALLEFHAQHEFRLLRNLPTFLWEKSKSNAANVYMDDLKSDKEIGEIFKCATLEGSLLYGKFLIDRRDLMLLLKGNEPAIPLKFTDEYTELMSSSLHGKKKSSYYPSSEMEE